MVEQSHEDKFSVLIVDDIDANLFALRKTLEYYCPDFDIVEANSGEQALRKMLQHRSDLALIDIQMPGMSGFELVHLLKKRQSTASIPVIFLTAVFKSDEFRNQGFALGAVDYLSKPYDELFLINKVMAFYHAIKRERELKREILAARDSMHEAQKREAMATMVAGVAHDFNNLIGSIQGFVELAEEEVEPDSSMATYLEQIGISVERAKKLIEQMRFVKLNQLILKPISCSELIRTFKNGFTAYLRSNGYKDVELQILPLVEDLYMLADEGLIFRVLNNLAINAVHAMEEQTIKRLTIDIHRRNSLHKSDIVIRVQDTGCGMTEEVLKKIFDPFFTTKEVGKGTGLGMASVQEIIRLHKGTIEVQSEPGEGTTFELGLSAVDTIDHPDAT